MLQEKYVVGSKIYKTSENSFRYLVPDEIANVVSRYNTELFEPLLTALEIPIGLYNHTTWSNFANATTEIRRHTGIGNNVAYLYAQIPEDNFTTYTLQLWPSAEEFNTVQTEKIALFEALRNARSVLFSELGLAIEIRKSFVEIDTSTMKVKEIFEQLSLV